MGMLEKLCAAALRATKRKPAKKRKASPKCKPAKKRKTSPKRKPATKRKASPKRKPATKRKASPKRKKLSKAEFLRRMAAGRARAKRARRKGS